MPCYSSKSSPRLVVCRPPGPQPAVAAFITVYRDGYGPVEEPMGWKPGQLAWCRDCGRRRRMSSLMATVQLYYDPTFFCADRDDCAKEKRKRNAKRNAARRRRYAERKARERGES